MKQKFLVKSLVAAGALSVAALGSVATLEHPTISSAHAAPVAAQAAVAQPAGSVVLPNFASIVQQHGPAVVNISVKSKLEKTALSRDQFKLDPDDPFSQFFRGLPMPRMPQVPSRGQGSGFIVSQDGTILTNAHVVDGASVVTVKLTDKREYTAKVVGLDKGSDVAVLKIEATNLPTVRLPSSDNVQVGEWVLAIGSPYGFENTVTAGIVSAKSRALPDGSYVPFIQTDVAVNPGNSGGPLFNLKGEVIGINSQIYSRSGGSQGVSFAIPIEVAMNVQNQIQKTGKVTRGQLGITIQDVNQSLADSFGLKRPAGALVSSVNKDSPAAKAGVQPGDVIVRYNDREIINSSELPLLVSSAAPGSTARLDVLRDGKSERLNVTIGEMKGGKVAAATTTEESHGKLGISARPLTADEQKQAGVTGGVYVEQSSGAAAEAGIQTGDVILSFNGKSVKSVEDLRSMVAKAGTKKVALLVMRADARIFVPVDLG